MGILRFAVYLFDVDGTSLDSAMDICGAISEVMEREGRRVRHWPSCDS